MKLLILKDLVSNTGSNEEGNVLFISLQTAFLNNDSFILSIDSDLSMSSSFLNTSFGYFLDMYGLANLKKTVKFKGSKNQFSRLSDYINKYTSVYAI